MFQVTLRDGDGIPTLLIVDGKALERGKAVSFEFLTRDLLTAYNRLFVTIDPAPPAIAILSTNLVDNSGGTNMGMIIPPATDLETLRNAISTLADNQNRMVQDVNNLKDFALQIQEQVHAVESRTR